MAHSDKALGAFARLLPREFRERVFDPAYFDLQRGELQPKATPAGPAIGRVILVLECLRLVVPFILWRRGRPTRLAATLILILGAIAVAVQHVRYDRLRDHGRPRPVVPASVLESNAIPPQCAPRLERRCL